MAVVQRADMAVKANEILARFRPIAPKPSSLAVADGVVATNRVLCQLQSRPFRPRKRGRPSLVPAASPAAWRKRPAAPYPPLLCDVATTDAVATATSACVHMPSLPPAPAGAGDLAARLSPKVAAAEENRDDLVVERDLLRKLLEPKLPSPRAVRPVGSTIRVESIIRRADPTTCTAVAVTKTAADVEEELEADALPAVVSDWSNRVRLVNDAYKEMVGQPECSWLRAVAAASRRISGEVVLAVAEAASLPESYGPCDGKCASVSVPCDVTRMKCESRDYLFVWRFRTSDAGAPVSSSRSGELSKS
jgi:hypothetical protein